MPPQIPEDEASEFGSESDVAPEPEPVKVKAEKKGKTNTKIEEPEQEESLMVESENNMEEEDEELGDEEYVVEKITNHLVDEDGILRFEVKWEGYDKKSDRTWEPEENLETAEKVLEEYLEAAGGREEILRKWEKEKAEPVKKGKKRARSSTGVDTPTNGAKRGRKPKLEHPLESTPPASASNVDDKNFAPPTGNWEEQVKDIDACEGQGGVPIVFITWKSGHKSQHPLHQVYKRCPQKMLQFYERHLVFKRGDDS